MYIFASPLWSSADEEGGFTCMIDWVYRASMSVLVFLYVDSIPAFTRTRTRTRTRTHT
jgi:hypothetical protein